MANDPVDEGCYVLGKKREPAREEPDPVSIPVIPIIGLDDLIEHLRSLGRDAELASMHAYRERYGVAL